MHAVEGDTLHRAWTELYWWIAAAFQSDPYLEVVLSVDDNVQVRVQPNQPGTDWIVLFPGNGLLRPEQQVSNDLLRMLRETEWRPPSEWIGAEGRWFATSESTLTVASQALLVLRKVFGVASPTNVSPEINGLPGASLLATPASMTEALLSSRLEGGVFPCAEWPGTDLTDAVLGSATLIHGQLQGTTLVNSSAFQGKFSGINLSQADGREVRWSRCELRDADLRGADFTDASLRDCDFRGALMEGAILRGADLGGADLRGTSLRGIDLSGSSCFSTNLREADLEQADLSDSEFHDAVLTDANLKGANLTGVEFYKANLRGAQMKGAHLTGTKFGKTNLRGAQMKGASGVPEHVYDVKYDEDTTWPSSIRRPT